MDTNRAEALAEIVAASAALADLEAAQRDVWVSGAVAHWADSGKGADGTSHDLFAASLTLRDALAAADDGQPGADAIDALFAECVNVRTIGATVVANTAGQRSIVIELAQDGSATSDHALLLEVAGDGRLQTIAFSGPDPVAALAEDDQLEVAQLTVDAVAQLVLAVTAEPTPWDEALRLNQLVAVVRLRSVLDDPAFGIDLVVPEVAAYEPRPADPDDDRYARDLLRSTCGHVLDQAPPAEWRVATDNFAHVGHDTVDVLAAAAIAAPTSALTLARVSAAYVRPLSLDRFDPADRDAIDALEWADWLGAVVQLVRAGPGTEVTPLGLVDNINASPEVTTTIPMRDREYIAYAFGLTLHAWEVCGALDGDGCLTDLGAWLLPVGLALVAGAQLDSGEPSTSESS